MTDERAQQIERNHPRLRATTLPHRFSHLSMAQKTSVTSG